MPVRRKLDAREMRLLVFKKYLRKDGKLAKRAALHIARVTPKGRVVLACKTGEPDLLSVYTFPFLPFIYRNAPMCADCARVAREEGFDVPQTPVSNTGVNSKVE